MGTGATAYSRALLAVSLCAGCLASPPPSRLADDGGGGEADAASPAACIPGEVIPGTAFNASPVDSQSVCNIADAEMRDGAAAGLDRRFGELEMSCARWDAEFGACGCIGLDLHDLYPVAEFNVRAQPVQMACTVGCFSDGCGDGHTFTTWTGTELGTYTLAGSVEMTSAAMTDYPMEVDGAVRYVVVCRDLWGEENDDVAVDSIEVICGE